jgi:superfamily II DNA/RNA helicase
MPPEIRRITEQFLSNPVRVEVSRPASTVAATTQLLAKSGREPFDKRETLRLLLRSAEGLKNAIIFCNRKRDVATLHRSLLRHGFSVQALHGDMDQSARTAALEQFRKGEVTLLVASDVAARGLDIPEVSHIYNFDVPIHADDYVHRIGRTGRAGRTGTAISIVAGSNDAKAVAAIEKLIGQPIPWMDGPLAAASEPQQSPAAAPQRERQQPRRGRPDAQRQPQRQNAQRQPQPQQRPAAPVARIEDARPRRAPQPARPLADDPDSSHLPAFLLRPVPLKA